VGQWQEKFPVKVAEGEEGMILVPKKESYPYMWQRYGYITATYV